MASKLKELQPTTTMQEKIAFSLKKKLFETL